MQLFPPWSSKPVWNSNTIWYFIEWLHENRIFLVCLLSHSILQNSVNWVAILKVTTVSEVWPWKFQSSTNCSYGDVTQMSWSNFLQIHTPVRVCGWAPASELYSSFHSLCRRKVTSGGENLSSYRPAVGWWRANFWWCRCRGAASS